MQLIVTVAMKALDGGVLDRPVHPLDLAICPRMVRLGQTVLDPASPRSLGPVAQRLLDLADHVEAHRPGVEGVPVPGLLGELDAPYRCFSDRWRSDGSNSQNRWT